MKSGSSPPVPKNVSPPRALVALKRAGPMRVMSVRPSHPLSYERIFHDAGVAAGIVHLREPDRPEVRGELEPARLERAIGVVYRPDTELQSHYFHATLPHQFDEYIWIDETAAVRPLLDRLEEAEAGLRADIERAGNTLAAYIGELEERLSRTGPDTR